VKNSHRPDEVWELHDHDPAPVFYKRNVLMIGDAAHATLPFIGNGAAQAFEDVAVLSALFARVTECAQILSAFAAFDEVRRPRALAVAELSRKAGKLYFYDFEGFWKEEEGIEALKEKWRNMAAFTNDVDLATQNRLAIQAFSQFALNGASESGKGCENKTSNLEL
jgi:salicylate hydroxylase